ncbi:MAG TPA: hypothetical protein VGI10_28505 [Polyangiaceae bacterium]
MRNPIYGGTLDTTDNAIGALLTFTNAGTTECSGTVIASKGRTGFYLTAAHCVVQFDAQNSAPVVPIMMSDPTTMELRMGSDYSAPTASYGIIDATIPPQYNGSVITDYDVAVVRFAGITPSVPIISVMSAAQDSAVKFGAGSSVKVIGYGMTDTNMDNTLRNTVSKTVASTKSQDVVYDQSNGQGLCEGDSGGPALFDDSGTLLVAAVNSWVQGVQGADPCLDQGASVRASFHENFIATVFNNAPTQLSCQDCELASIGTGNACVTLATECADASTQCGMFAACFNSCTGTAQSCLSSCGVGRAAGLARYNQYISCVCNDCSVECQAAPVCASAAGGAGGTSGGGAGSGGTAGAAGGAAGSGTSGASGNGTSGTSASGASSGGASGDGAGAGTGVSGSVATGGSGAIAGFAGSLIGGQSAGGASGAASTGGADLAEPTAASRSNVSCKCSAPGASVGLDARASFGLLGLGLVLARRRSARRSA